MAVSKSDALQIYNKFFRGLELKGLGSRKYSFGISGINQEAVSTLHRELYMGGSDITRQEILSFIDQREVEKPIAFLYLPVQYIVLGEVVEVTQRVGNERPYTLVCVKLSDSHYLVWSKDVEVENLKGVVSLSYDAVLGELYPSPITEGAIILAVNIIPPPNFYRLLDFILLDERYPETVPSSVLPLYSKLVDAHVGNRVNSEWQDILAMASSTGISTYTVFKILGYVAVNF